MAADHEEEEVPEIPEPKGGVREFPKPALTPEPAPPDIVERVRNVPAAADTGEPVEKAQILKGYEIEKDRYVTLEPNEVKALRPQTSSELAIAEFVRFQEVDPTFLETSYYVEPDSGGEKPYALLFQALSETDYVAVGSLAMHGREHATIVRPGRHGLILHTLFFANEVRGEQEYHTDAGLLNARELDLAKLFVRTLAAPFDPAKLKDAFEERLRELIEARAETAVETNHRGEPKKAAPVIDIMEALKQSLAMARKQPERERKSPRKSAVTSETRRRNSKS